MKVSVVGSGGHARSLIPLALNCKLEIAGVFDDGYKAPEKIYSNISLSGKLQDIPSNHSVILAIGNNHRRAQLFSDLKVYQTALVHSSAIVDPTVSIGIGNQVFPFAFINSGVRIGSNNILNSGCIIEHEAIIGNNNHISIGARIAGRVRIGSNCMIGASATVIDGVSICDNVTLGAGAVVVENIIEAGTYAGVPARRLK